MTVKKLKAFRAKLVKARDYEITILLYPTHSNVTLALQNFKIHMSDEVWFFLTSLKPRNRRDGVAALFANSIAAIDAQIAERVRNG